MKTFYSSLLLTLPIVASAPLAAQTMGLDFVADYSYIDLGTPTGVPAQLGGLNFKPGDNNTLLIGGNANNSSGALYEVPLTRDSAGHISSFGGPAVYGVDAPNIDGGVAFSPDGVMFVTTYANNNLLQYLPGSTVPDSTTSLTPLGINSSVGTCVFVPSGFPGAGTFKIASYNTSQWYDVELTLNAAGTYDLGTVTSTVNSGGGPEGIVYVSGGNTGFTANSVLVSEYSGGSIGTFEIDSNGDPIPSTRRDFMTNLGGAEGAIVDPVTGDFLFSTFGGGNRVLVVSGFDQPTIFCGGKVNSLGCVPTIEFVGVASETGADTFTLMGSNMLPNQFGILVWSTTPGNVALGGGTLCLSGHFYRHPVQFSGNGPVLGTPCTGGYTDFLSQSWFTQNGLMTGTTVYAQYVSRDPGFAPPNNYALSDGLRFTIRD